MAVCSDSQVEAEDLLDLLGRLVDKSLVVRAGGLGRVWLLRARIRCCEQMVEPGRHCFIGGERKPMQPRGMPKAAWLPWTAAADGEDLCLLVLTLVAISEREFDAAKAYGQRALEVFRAQDHRWGVTTALLVLTHIAMNRKSPAFTSLLEESAALLKSGPDRWGRAHVLNLRGYEALSNLDLDRAQVLYTASHELAVELGDRAGQAENLLALGHIHLLRAEPEEARRALQENRSLLEQLHDHHLAHADQALALLAISSGCDAEGEALFQDVTRRLSEMGLTMMGGTYALGIADLYRRAGQPQPCERVAPRHDFGKPDDSVG